MSGGNLSGVYHLETMAVTTTTMVKNVHLVMGNLKQAELQRLKKRGKKG